MKGYLEGRIIFDRYITGSLKEKTRVKRAGTTQPVKFIIPVSMNINNVPIKLLLSHVDTKSQLTEYLGKRLLEHFAMSEQGLVVVFGITTTITTYTNKDTIVNKNLLTHSREEADTQIPLHVIDVTTQGTLIRDIYVWSPDTDVFLLLMDLVANCTLHVPGQLKYRA